LQGQVAGAGAAPAVASKQPQVDARSVVVTGLPLSITEQVVYAHFSAVGVVNRLTLVKNHVTGVPIGTAYVEFEEPAGAQKALKLTGEVVKRCMRDILYRNILFWLELSSLIEVGFNP
jgi:RNA recognition motif-containing protein